MHKIFPLACTNGDIIDFDTGAVIGCWSRAGAGSRLPSQSITSYYQAEVLGYKSPVCGTLDEVSTFIQGVAQVINKVNGFH